MSDLNNAESLIAEFKEIINRLDNGEKFSDIVEECNNESSNVITNVTITLLQHKLDTIN